MEKTGENQSIVRNINMKLVIDLLRIKPCSVTFLALQLKLSNTAVTKIIDELGTMNLVLETDKVIAAKAGRRRVNYKLNENYGIVGVVNFAQKEMLACDLSGNILKKSRLPETDKFDLQYFQASAEGFRRFIGEDAPKLLSVSVVSLGKINHLTHEYIYALNVKDYEQVHFSELFGSQVTVNNDIAMGLSGEVKSGAFEGAENGMYVYVNESIASSLYLNGKPYCGKRGFAGELGLNSGVSYDRLEATASLKAVSQKLHLTIPELIRQYLNHDEKTLCAVDASAAQLSQSLKNVSELLDLEVIVLSGPVTDLGDRYIGLVKEYLSCYPYLDTKIIYSKIGNQAISIGAIEAGVTAALEMILNKRKQEEL